VEAAAGKLPELANSFSLVFDPVDHDDPYFNGVVPVRQYVWHIAMRQVPVARPGTSAHSHDMAHLPGYRRMFQHAYYADLVQLAAFNALASPERCEQFADAHDHFADQMLFLYRDDGFNQIAQFPKIETYLNTLIQLAHVSAGYESEEAPLYHEAAFEELVSIFELEQYKHWYDTVDERFQTL
jgi:hypothetical protein